jgi:hypothetical protein
MEPAGSVHERVDFGDEATPERPPAWFVDWLH